MSKDSTRPLIITELCLVLPPIAPLLDRYDEEWWADGQVEGEPPGLYNYMDVIWSGYLKPALSKSSSTENLIVFFEWLERVATKGTPDEVTWVKWGVLELIGDRDDWLRHAESLMGCTTQLLFVETELALGRKHHSESD